MTSTLPASMKVHLSRTCLKTTGTPLPALSPTTLRNPSGKISRILALAITPLYSTCLKKKSCFVEAVWEDVEDSGTSEDLSKDRQYPSPGTSLSGYAKQHSPQSRQIVPATILAWSNKCSSALIFCWWDALSSFRRRSSSRGGGSDHDSDPYSRSATKLSINSDQACPKCLDPPIDKHR